MNDFRTVVACLVLNNTFAVIFSVKSGEDAIFKMEVVFNWLYSEGTLAT